MRHVSWKAGRKNAPSLLNALYCLVSYDGPPLAAAKKTKIQWEGTSLWVKEATLRSLVSITEEFSENTLTTEEIRNVLKCLEKIKIFVDKRAKNNAKTRSNSPKWNFELALKSIDGQENLVWLFGKDRKFGTWDRLKNDLIQKPVRASKSSQTQENNLSQSKNTGGNTQDFFDTSLTKWRLKKELIYSAPASIFLSGEHSVVFGHAAIYLPLPLRLYVHLEKDFNRHTISIDSFKCPDPRNYSSILQTEMINDYGRHPINEHINLLQALFSSTIKPFLTTNDSQKYGLNINVLSSFPVAVGLNSSGAFSTCISQGIVDNFLDLEGFKGHFGIQEKTKDQVTLLLAWAIENCFHRNSSSGAGIASAFYGRKGKHPLIYCTSRRSRLSHRLIEDWRPVEIQEDPIRSLAQINFFVMDPSKQFETLPSYPQPPDYNLTVLYSGTPSRTGDVLSYKSIRQYTKGSIERVMHVHKVFNETFKDQKVHRSLDVHNNEIIDRIYLRNLDNDSCKNDEIAVAYLELFSEALGNISIGLLNSVLSDWQVVPEMMNSYQALLASTGLSDPITDLLVAKLKLSSLEYQVKEGQHMSQMGVKITGSGKGGDIIVFSIHEAELHQEIIERNIDPLNAVHFDSYQLPTKIWGSSVKGVHREKKA